MAVRRASALALLLFAAASPVHAEPVTPDALYAQALEAHGRGDHSKAATLLFSWLAGTSAAVENYDLAQHLLAEELAAQGLLHAAVVREVAVARNRARPELLPEALERLQRWTDQAPVDDGRVFAELIHETDFGPLPPSVAAWVAFQQGALDLKEGHEDWAKARFAQIPEGTALKARARLLLAVLHVDAAPDDVLKELESLAAEPGAAVEVRNDARIQAARLRYDRGDFQQALTLYEAVDLPELDPGRGQIRLEQAWALYRLGAGGRAMGRLAALDAPSFRGLFLPDKYLLRAFIFKDACQLLAAKVAARGLTRRYRTSLDAIQQRRSLTADADLLRGVSDKGVARRLERLQGQLEQERRIAERIPGDLGKHLMGLYAVETAEIDRQRQLARERDIVEVADSLLHDAEQVQLIDYEVGLALYRRDHGAPPPSPLAFESDDVQAGEESYDFDGEYWNDELEDYRFHLENRCGSGVTR